MYDQVYLSSQLWLFFVVAIFTVFAYKGGHNCIVFSKYFMKNLQYFSAMNSMSKRESIYFISKTADSLTFADHSVK